MAFLQSAPPRQPIFRAPAVVLWLIAVLAALHLWRITRPGEDPDGILYQFAFYPLRYSHAYLESHMVNPGTLWERAAPFVSYIGLHDSWTHVIANSLFLFAFGPIVARRWGAVLFLVFFLLCGVAAALVFLAFNWGDPVYVLGASGAICGLMPAALRLLPAQAPWVVQSDAPLASMVSRPLLVFTAFFVVANLAAGLTGWSMASDNPAVAWQAHLGGYLAGLLLSGPFDRLRPRSVGARVDQ
jgi:membrane associated rhomboid family serine protease